ncbi:LacI family DNA-binding transcriptional regulator [Actinopolymorpha sp. B11F2]
MVGIVDVARHAKVSASTVSYVLSGKRPISPETQRRVHASIRALGYHPHAGARALASKRSNVLALVVPLRTGVHVPVLMQFVTAVVTRAREVDHDVLLLTQDEGERGLRRVEASALADAIIVMDVELDDVRVPLVRSLRTPCVLIGFPADAEGLTCVDLDFAAAGRACVGHLADLGHRRMGLVGSPPAVYARGTGFATRVAGGVASAAAERGVLVETRACEPTREAAFAAIDELLQTMPELTGLVVHNESVIESVLAALRERDRRVPDDISVVAICPDELAARLDLSCVALPADDVGRRAVDLAMAKLSQGVVPAATQLAPRLTARATSACAVEGRLLR